jgi:ParB/RepB/Spo0J family partition protein
MPVATPNTGTLQVRLDRLFVPDNNIREIDEEWVASLRRSIRARGTVVDPVEVIDADPTVHGEGYDHVLVAGFHRTQAARLEGLEVVPGFYGDPEQQEVDRALENIMRKPLNPYEEARAVKAMLDGGNTEDGAAELLGWDKRRVTARVKLLELPERAQQLVGDGTIALSAVDGMRAIASTDPALLDLVLDHVAEYAEEYEPDVLARRPLEVLAGAAEEREDVFLAYLAELPLQRLEALQLDEATLALVDEALKLNTQLTGWSHLPRFRFGEAEIDRARALGVLLEHGDEAPLVSDFAVYQDLCRTAVAAGVEGLRQRVREREEEREAEGASASAGERAAQSDELSELERSHRRAMRELAATAHGANLDLGESLRSGLGIVDPADINVARFFVYGLLGPDTHNSYNLNNPVSAIALRGIRLVNPDFREDVTKTRQDGSKGALRIVYGDGRDHADQASWLWKYLAGAKTAGELYGRALVVIAAEHYASRLVVPASQQHHPLDWSSHKESAIKALEKLAGPHVATTLKALEKAIAKAETEYKDDREQVFAAERKAGRRAAEAPSDQPADHDGGDLTLGEEDEPVLDGPLELGVDELAIDPASSGEDELDGELYSGEAAPADEEEETAAIAAPAEPDGPPPVGDDDGAVIDAAEEIEF